MSISIKTAREIEKMRRAGELLEKVHDELGRAIHPGMSTWEINKLGEEMIRSFGCTPNFLNYNGYPASICVSVNEEVVHGIPSKKRILKEGDIVSLDAGLIYEGYHSDAARTHAVGEISPEARKLVEVTRQAFFEGIKYAKAGHHLHFGGDRCIRRELRLRRCPRPGRPRHRNAPARRSGSAELRTAKPRRPSAAWHDARHRADDHSRRLCSQMAG